MNCKDIDKLIVAFLDGELTDNEQALIKKHLATCQYHKKEIEALTVTRDNLRQAIKSTATRYSPRPDAWERLKQQITIAEKSKAAKQGIVESILKAISNFGRNCLVFRWADWKAGLISILAIALIVILAVTMPLLIGPDNEALAVEIALNSPEVQAALGIRSVDQAEVVAILDEESGVFVSLRTGDDYLLIVEVNPGIKEVIQLYSLELTAEVKQRAIDIAVTDSRIQNLVEQGANMSSFFPMYYIEIQESISSDGTIYKEGSVEFRIGMRINFSEDEYAVYINLTKGEVDFLTRITN